MNLQTETFTIDGMSCSHCVMAVKKALDRLPGVDIHNVEIGTARLTFDLDRTSRDTLVQTIEEEGYSVQL